MRKAELRAIIRQKMDQLDRGADRAAKPPDPKPPQPTFLLDESVLELRVQEVLARLSPHKELFTPSEVAFALSKSDKWVRERFRNNPRCFNTGNRTKVYLSIPRSEIAEEVRKMCRFPHRLRLAPKLSS